MKLEAEFEGLLQTTTRIHHNGTNANTTIANLDDYDHIGKKLKSYQQIGTDTVMQAQQALVDIEGRFLPKIVRMYKE